MKSPLESKFLTEIEVDLTAFLRKELRNDHISLKTHFDKQDAPKKAYTNAEIFNEMAKKNPDLLKLKDSLGLDTEF